MKTVKYFAIFVVIILLNISCERSKNELNPLIVGNWQLIEVYGIKADNSVGWFTVQNSPTQTIKFNSGGEYIIAADGNITCSGNFVFNSDNSLKMNPTGCMPLIESVETIYKLTQDTLTISNRSNSISSFNLRKDKYIRNN